MAELKRYIGDRFKGPDADKSNVLSSVDNGAIYFADDSKNTYQKISGSWELISTLNIGGLSGNFSEGSIPFANAVGNLIEDNSNLYFDNSNNFLGIQTNNPTYSVHSAGSGAFEGKLGVGTTGIEAMLHVVGQTSGETVARVEGTQGTLFSVTDSLEDSLFSVNNIAGIPVFEAFSDDRIVMGEFNAHDFILKNNNIGFGTPSPDYKLQISGDVVPELTESFDLGKENLKWGNVFAANLSGAENVFLSGFSDGSILFADSVGKITEDVDNFKWDGSPRRLTINSNRDGIVNIIDTGAQNTQATLYTTIDGSQTLRLQKDGSIRMSGPLSLYSGVSALTGTLKTYLNPEGNSWLNGGNVGINTTSPSAPLHIVHNSTEDALFIITSEDGSSAGPVLDLCRESASADNGDYLGQVKFKGNNDIGQTVVYSKITAKIGDATDTTEDGLLEVMVKKDGTNTIVSRFTSSDLKLINGVGLQVDGDVGIGTTSPDYKLQVDGEIAPETANAYDIGAASLPWRQLYLQGGIHITGSSQNSGALVFNNTYNGATTLISVYDTDNNQLTPVLRRANSNGAISLGTDDSLILGAGESRSTVESNYAVGNETLIGASDFNILFYTNLQNGWGSKNTIQITQYGDFVQDDDRAIMWGIDSGAYIRGNTSSNQLILGNNGTGVVYVDEHFYPAFDNQIDLGKASSRWRDLYVAGTIYATGISADVITGDFSSGSVLFAGPQSTIIEDNTQFYWDDVNNRLGIGTNVPDERLDVRGALQLGDAGASSYTNLNTTDYYEFRHNGTGNLYLQGNKVGVGISSPEQFLHIEAGSSSDLFALVENTTNGASSRAGYQLKTTDGSAAMLLTSPSYSAVSSWDDRLIISTDSNVSNGIRFRTATGPAIFSMGSTTDPDLYINNGLVGIGTNSPSDGDISTLSNLDGQPVTGADYLFHIEGGTNTGHAVLVARFEANSDSNFSHAAVRINHINDRGLQFRAGRQWGDRGEAYFDITRSDGAFIPFLHSYQVGGHYVQTTLAGNPLIFKAGGSEGSLGTEAMRIISGGNVSIGGTTADALLDLRGDVDLNGNYLTWAHDGSTNANNDYIASSDGAHTNGNGNGFFLFKHDSSRDTSAEGGNSVLDCGNIWANRSEDNYFAGNVGVGTKSPVNLLHLKSSTNINVEFLKFEDSDGNILGDVSTDSAGNNRLHLEDTSSNITVKLNTNGSSYFNGGNVGIGTTNPSTLLDITGGILSIRGDEDAAANIYSTDGSWKYFQWYNGSRTYYNGLDNTANRFVFGADAAGSQIYYFTNTDVGIGTSSPSTDLDVAGGANFDGGVTGQKFDSDLFASNSHASNSFLDFDYDDWSEATNVTYLASVGYMVFATDTNNNGPADFVWFSGGVDPDNGSELMRLTNEGNLGVGGVNPSHGIHLQKLGSNAEIRIESDQDAFLTLEADNDNATEDHNAYIKFLQDGGLVPAIVGLVGNAGSGPDGTAYTNTTQNAFLVGHEGTYDLQFGTNDAVRMSIKPAGNIGVNTTSPTARFHVAGTTNLVGNTTGQNIVPSADSTYDLGSSSLRWANLYVDTIDATDIASDFTQGSVIFADADGDLTEDNNNLNFDNSANILTATNINLKTLLSGSNSNGLINLINTNNGSGLALGQFGASNTLRFVPNGGNLSSLDFNYDIEFDFDTKRWNFDGPIHVLDTLNIGSYISGDLTVGKYGNYHRVKITNSDSPIGSYNGEMDISSATIPGAGTATHLTRFLTTGIVGTTRHDVMIDGRTALGSTIAPSKTLEISGNFEMLNGNIDLARASYITFYGNDSLNHSISSRDAQGVANDDLRVNSYGAIYLNLDSNNNNISSANFQIGRHGGTSTISDWFLILNGENGKLGIGSGISAPTYGLDLTLSGTSDRLNISRGGSTKFYFNGDGVARWGSSASHGILSWDTEKAIIGGLSDRNFSMYAGGSEKAVLTTGGNFGIGTTSPSEKLEVAGNAILDATDATLKIKAGSVGTHGQLAFTFNTDSTIYGSLGIDYDNRSTDGLLLQTPNYPVTIKANHSEYIRFNFDTTERVRIQSDGFVGINTVSPLHLLNIVSTAVATDSASFEASAGNSEINVRENSVQNTMHIQGKDNAGTVTLVLQPYGNSYLNGSDVSNFGVGTNNPLAKLNVLGDSLFAGNITGRNIFPQASGIYDIGSESLRWSDIFGETLNLRTTTPTNFITIEDTATSEGMAFRLSSNEDFLMVPQSGGSDVFAQEFGYNNTNEIWFCDTKFGVKTTSPTADLNVVGTTYLGGNTTGQNIVPQADSNYDLGSSSLRWANLYVDTIDAADISSDFTQGSVIFADSDGDLAEDNSNFYWNDTDNELGIGTTSTVEKLTVNGNIVSINSSAKIGFADGNGADVYMTFDDNNPTFTGGNATHYVGGGFKFIADKETVNKGNSYIQSKVVDTQLVQSWHGYYSGVVGIGTPTPNHELTLASTSSYPALEFRNDGSVSDGTELGRIFANDGAGNYFAGIKMMYHDSNDGELRIRQKVAGTNTDTVTFVDGRVGIGTTGPVGNLTIRTDASDEVGIRVETASSKVFTVDNEGDGYFAGNVGIGTDIPSGTLQLHDSSRVDLIFSNDGDETHYIRKDGDFLRFRGDDDSTVIFELQNNSNGSNRASFPNGNVGIGTTSSAESLEIANGNIFLDSDTDEAGIAIQRGSERKWWMGVYSGAVDDQFMISYGGSINTNNVFTIAESNVGIGTSTPSRKFQLQNGSGLFQGTQGGMDVRIDTTSAGNSTLSIDRQTSAGKSIINFEDAGNVKWEVGDRGSSNNFEIYNQDLSERAFVINESTNGVGIGTNDIDGRFVIETGVSIFGACNDNTSNYSVTRSLSIFSVKDDSPWFSWIGQNLFYDGANFIKGSDNATSNWGNLCGIKFQGTSSNSIPAIRFVTDYAQENGTNYTLGSDDSYIDNNTHMVIMPSGQIGIGTASPNTELEVNGTIRSTSLEGFSIGSDAGQNRVNTYSAGTKIRFLDNGNSYAEVGVRSLVVGSAFVTSEVTENGGLIVGGNVGVGTDSPSYKLEVNGSFAATTKSFVIDHPTKEGKKLQYGVTEAPEHSVFVRGRTKSNIIELPDYWTGLVHEDSITVNLTPIGKHQKLYVEDIRDNKVIIANDSVISNKVNCFYTIFAERKDVEKLQVEV